MLHKSKAHKKIIGTALPIFSLRSSAQFSKNNGTFSDGLIFLDWLKATGQSGWQILPLSQSHLVPGSKRSHASSPYHSYGIGLDPKFLAVIERGSAIALQDKKIFMEQNKDWLDDYAFFCALRDYFGTDNWPKWPAEIRLRRIKAMSKWRCKLAASYDRHIIEQYRLHRSFFELKKKSSQFGISIIGDISFYLPLQSPLVWANQKSFDLKPDGKMLKVSGLPDSSKAHFGRQVWGHPLYNWQRRRQWSGIIRLWKLRINYLSQLHDMLRLDHAKGFYYYGIMKLNDSQKDSFLKGPGFYALAKIVKYAQKKGLEIFAEDAGDRLKGLRAGLKKLKVPGIRMLRFAYNEKMKSFENSYANINSYKTNTYAYTTTHDTEPLIGYIRLLTVAEKRGLCQRLGIKYSGSEKILAERLRNLLLRSPSRVVIIPIQDWLLIPNRINKPGTEKMRGDRNWRFRLPVPIEKLPIKNIKRQVLLALKTNKLKKNG